MKLLKKLDENLLKGLLTLFIFFIPLYPKFPFMIVNFTYIAIRFDDFLTAFIVAVFVIQLLRGKVSFKHLKFKKEIAIFWGIVFLALLSGLFLTKTIDYANIGFLHAARRVQYMIMFFVAMSQIKSIRDFKYYMYTLLSVLVLILVYGVGQRLFEFPAVSTMNPEFAKGRLLTLTPEARLTSTFAGHYDLGAYLVFFYPIVFGLYFYVKRFSTTLKERLFLLFAGMAPFIMMMYAVGAAIYEGNPLAIFVITAAEPGNFFVLMTMLIAQIIFLGLYRIFPRTFLLALLTTAIAIIVSTASRTSSIAFMASIIAYLIYVKKPKWIIFVLILLSFFTYKDSDLVERWANTIQIRQIIINEKTGEEVVVQQIRPDQLPAGTAFVNRKKDAESDLSKYIKDDLIRKATLSGALKDATAGGITTEQDYETYSAVAADISIATRFQVSWPRAIGAFLQNPLLGTGPSSITESSDGDYFRWIGEMGALGAASFIYVIGSIMKYLYDKRNNVSLKGRYILYGVIFGTAGLFINAILIDVFEASKVAYIFWATLGLFVGLVGLKESELKKL